MGFDTVLINVALLIALAIPGFLLRKFKVFKEASIKALVMLLIYAAQPAMVAKSFLSLKFSAELGWNILFIVLAFAAVMLIVLAVSLAFFRNKKSQKILLANQSNNQPQSGQPFFVDQNGQGDQNCVQSENELCQGQLLNGQGDQNCAQSENELCQGQLLNGQGDQNCAQSDANTQANNQTQSKFSEQPDQSNANIAVSQKIENNRLYRFASMFGNTGYLGLPLISVLFPKNDVMLLYTSLCIVIFNIMTWTVGVFVLTGDKKSISLKKCLLTPVPLTALATIPIFFVSALVIPAPIIKFFDSLGTMTTPLSMIIMGARMAEIPFREIFSDLKIYVVSALRLLVAPAAAFGILKLFQITNVDLYNTLLVICMMPCAAATIVFAEKFLKNSYSAIKAVLLSSILCIITIPLLCLFLLI